MFVQYTQDFDEGFPMAFYGTSSTGTTNTWVNFMQPYIKSQQVFSCPSESQATGAPIGATFPAHYAYNFYLGGNGAGTPFTILPRLVKASETVLATDSGAVPVSTGVPPDQWQKKLRAAPYLYLPTLLLNANSTTTILDSPTLNSTFGAPFARHLSTCNVLWADGHVKAQRIETFYKATATSPCLDPDTGCT